MSRRKPQPVVDPLTLDPSFWWSVSQISLRQRIYVSGASETFHTLKTADGHKLQIAFSSNVSTTKPNASDLHTYVSMAARQSHKVREMAPVMARIAQVDTAFDKLRPAALAKAKASQAKAIAKRKASERARARKWFFAQLHRLAAAHTIERDELAHEWDIGIVEDIHES